MDDIQVIDNFLDEKYFKELQETIFDPMFTWQKVYTESHHPHGFLFSHPIFITSPVAWTKIGEFKEIRSPWFPKFFPFFKKLKMLSLIRIKVNLLSRTEERVTHEWHRDVCHPTDCPNIRNAKNSILYMNTNNGVTILEDTKEEIKSVANRLITFSSAISHTGTTHTDKDIPDRCLINFNYF